MAEKTETPWRKWSEPATKGDVVRAIIWTRTLATAGAELAAAQNTGDEAKVAEALAHWRREWAELTEVMNEIGGAAND